MTFTVEQNRLLYNGVSIFEAPGAVKIECDLKDRALILYNSYGLYDAEKPKVYETPLASEDEWVTISRNVLMVGQDGKVVWRIDNHNYKNIPARYLQAGFIEERRE